MRNRWRSILIMFAAVWLMVMTSGTALATWSAQDVGTLGGITAARAINNPGQVGGGSRDASNNYHAFLWDSTNGIQDLGTLGGTRSYTYGINNLGQATGYAFPTSSTISRCFIWSSADGMVELPTLGGLSTDKCLGQAINDAGHVAGNSYYSGGGTNYHAFFYQDGLMLDLGVLSGDTASSVSGMNNADQVVGKSTVSTSTHAFIWDPVNLMQPLPALPGVTDPAYAIASASGINDAGVVVGDSYNKNATGTYPVMWIDGVPTELQEVANGVGGNANAINNLNQIVGNLSIQLDTSRVTHAMLWTDGRVIDLTDAAAATGYTALNAYGINDSGQIICSGTPNEFVLTQNLKVTAFTMASPTAENLTVPVVSFEATDTVGVTGYLITVSATAPDYNDSGWSGAAPTEFTFTDAGNTAYAWVKDAQGNVSFGVKASAPVTADTVAPTVTAFTVPATSTSLTVAITTFTASDDTGVTGYMVTESNTPPAADDAGWSVSAPTEYTFANYGAKVLYAWAKDAAGNVSVSVSANVVVEKATATVTLGNLTTTYDGTPKAATVTTDPAGLTVDITYDGSATAPTNAGSYAAVATINDADYQGTASGTLVIGKATATVTLGSLTAAYNGQPKAATATTNPAGLTVVITYDGSATAPTNAGSYAVVATVNDANYQGTANGTLVIDKATSTITLHNMTAIYDGSPKPVTATPSVSGLSVTVTYNGSTTVPSAAGSYAVVATVSDANYQGTASCTLNIVEGDLVRIGSTAYPTLTSALAAATTGTVMARSVTFEESPVINSATVFRGGYDSQFASNSGNYTAVSGTVTVSKGSLTVEGMVIR